MGSAGEPEAQGCGGLVFLRSISAVQWLCNADKKSHSPPKRLYRFFSTLYTALVSVTLCQSLLVHVSKIFYVAAALRSTRFLPSHLLRGVPRSSDPRWSPAPGRAAEELPLQPEQPSWGVLWGVLGRWALMSGGNWATEGAACTETVLCFLQARGSRAVLQLYPENSEQVRDFARWRRATGGGVVCCLGAWMHHGPHRGSVSVL